MQVVSKPRSRKLQGSLRAGFRKSPYQNIDMSNLITIQTASSKKMHKRFYSHHFCVWVFCPSLDKLGLDESAHVFFRMEPWLDFVQRSTLNLCQRCLILDVKNLAHSTFHSFFQRSVVTSPFVNQSGNLLYWLFTKDNLIWFIKKREIKGTN